MFAASPFSLALTVAVAVIAYASLVAMLRLAGSRSVAKWNAFDLIVTVALGSSLATVILSDRTPAASGIAAFAVLVGLQYAITWLSVRFRAWERVVKSRPVLLLQDGELRHAAMRGARVTESELRAAVRGSGRASLQEIGAVVLETDGSISVIGTLGTLPPTALEDVEGADIPASRLGGASHA